jgi:hypothetical protein
MSGSPAVGTLHLGHLMTTFQTGGLERLVESLSLNARLHGIRR